MTDKWPKTWEEIKDNTDESRFTRLNDTWIEFCNGLRGYRGAMYASISLGEDIEENEDEWMPFDQYINYKIEEIQNETNN